MEIEARFINVSQEALEGRPQTLGAQKVFDAFFREWIFVYPEWKEGSRRLRVRTDGNNSWLTYKANATWEVDSTEEAEVEISSAAGMVAVLEAIGIPLLRFQEKKRIRYQYGTIAFDFDFWPKIPMVLEIEAPTKEEVEEGARLVGLEWKDALFIDALVLHRECYGINLSLMTEYRFEDLQ